MGETGSFRTFITDCGTALYYIFKRYFSVVYLTGGGDLEFFLHS
jgi:hypothetical protein